MKTKISTPVAAVLVVLAIGILACVAWQFSKPAAPPPVPPGFFPPSYPPGAGPAPSRK